MLSPPFAPILPPDLPLSASSTRATCWIRSRFPARRSIGCGCAGWGRSGRMPISKRTEGLRGRQRWALLEDLAGGVMTDKELAETHAVPIADLADYRSLYSVEIGHIRAGTVDDYWKEWLARERAGFIEKHGIDPLAPSRP